MEFEPDIEINDADLKKLIDGGIKAIQGSIKLTATELWGNLGREAPVDEGRLAGSFDLNQVDDQTWRITSNVLYALMVQEGTGVFGPTGQPIVPVSASFLVFEIGGETIFARSVRGMQPDPYVDRAMDLTEQRVDEFAAMALAEAGVS